MGEELIWRYIQDKQKASIYPGGKSLYSIHDQNKLSRDAKGQFWYPMVIGAP